MYVFIFMEYAFCGRGVRILDVLVDDVFKACLNSRFAATSGAVEPEPRKFGGLTLFTWQKILALGFMFFCILFNYTILRDTKDVLVVTAPGSGAEIIPFLKTWVNLPMAIGFTILYAKVTTFH